MRGDSLISDYYTLLTNVLSWASEDEGRTREEVTPMQQQNKVGTATRLKRARSKSGAASRKGPLLMVKSTSTSFSRGERVQAAAAKVGAPPAGKGEEGDKSRLLQDAK